MLPNMSATSACVPRVSHSHPLLPQETLPDQQVGLAQAPIKLLFLLLVPVCVRFCVHCLRLKSLFPPILRSFCNQALLAFKTKCSGGSCFQLQTSGLGELTWCSNLSL